MYDNYIMIAIGLVLVIASVLAKGFSYGMAPHQQKPVYPATRRLRVVLLLFGLLSFAVGLVRVLRR
jgi:uncharacterized protein YjeT (DUF2065 family)